ncbi:MAG: response regulator [Imperialibacter sp.]|uniref:response regulator n=1 Tax=Imperialibacter sp. TaxID=2038411 RepID=UPI0032EF21C0
MNNLRILVVEDKDMVAQDIKETLKEIGYGHVDTANTGEMAIRMFEASNYGLVLMDINLKGGLDGISTSEKIHKVRAVPVIYLTAYSDKATVSRAVKTAPAGYLVKPFDSKDIEIAIELAVANNVNVFPLNETGSRTKLLKTGNSNKNILNEEIIYARAAGSYTDLFTASGRHTLSMNLSSFMKKTVAKNFIRVHRSYSININFVKGMKSNRLIVGNLEIPIGRSHRRSLKEFLDTN